MIENNLKVSAQMSAPCCQLEIFEGLGFYFAESNLGNGRAKVIKGASLGCFNIHCCVGL